MIAAALIATLQKTLAGKDVTADFVANSGYLFDPTDAADLRARLPPGWSGGSLMLVKREESGQDLHSLFRLGPPGDTRLAKITTDMAGKLKYLFIVPDPDAR